MATTRKALDEATKTKMHGRTMASGFRQSRLKPDFLFNDTEVIFHVVGNEDVRAVFIEYFDGKFDLYSVDASVNIPEGYTKKTAKKKLQFNFIRETLTLPAARARFIQMGCYYFGYCKPKTDVASITGKLINPDEEFHAFADFTGIINAAFKASSLFDEPEYIEKTKYDAWLAEWDKPLSKEFKHIDNNNARKVLQMLELYLSGGAAGRFFTGKWHHHHCNEIVKVLTPLKTPHRETLAFIDTPKGRKKHTYHERDDSEVAELLERSDSRTSLSFASTNSSKTVGDILSDLEYAIHHSENPEIKKHGDLYALLLVIQDHTEVNYFTLRAAAVDRLVSTV